MTNSQPAVHQEVDRGVFLATFVGTGAVAAWCSLAQRVYAQRWFAYSFGASNAVYGIVAACCIVQSLRSEYVATPVLIADKQS